MVTPLMPKATAVWLVDNTALTFEQIGSFCGLHPLEVKGIADDEVAVGIQGLDPISNGQLTAEEIERCLSDSSARLELAESNMPRPQARTSGPRYTPVSKRQDRPSAIMWLLRYHEELSDAQVSKLVGTTKPTINSVRERTHWNIANIKPMDPVSLGMCTQAELDTAVTKAQARRRAREEKELKSQGGKGAGTAAAATAAATAATATETPEVKPEQAPPDLSPRLPVEEEKATAESVFGAAAEAPESEPEPALDPDAIFSQADPSDQPDQPAEPTPAPAAAAAEGENEKEEAEKPA